MFNNVDFFHPNRQIGHTGDGTQPVSEGAYFNGNTAEALNVNSMVCDGSEEHVLQCLTITSSCSTSGYRITVTCKALGTGLIQTCPLLWLPTFFYDVFVLFDYILWLVSCDLLLCDL